MWTIGPTTASTTTVVMLEPMSSTAAFKYFDVNRDALDITDGELTTNDDGSIANAQVDFTGAVFMNDNAYYSASPWFGWGFQ